MNPYKDWKAKLERLYLFEILSGRITVCTEEVSLIFRAIYAQQLTPLAYLAQQWCKLTAYIGKHCIPAIKSLLFRAMGNSCEMVT